MFSAQVQPHRPRQRVSATARLTRGTCVSSASAAMRYGSSRVTAKTEAVVVAAKKGDEVAQRFPSRSSVTHAIRGAAVRAVHAVFCARSMTCDRCGHDRERRRGQSERSIEVIRDARCEPPPPAAPYTTQPSPPKALRRLHRRAPRSRRGQTRAVTNTFQTKSIKCARRRRLSYTCSSYRRRHHPVRLSVASDFNKEVSLD